MFVHRSSWRLNRPQSDNFYILCIINKHFFQQSGGWASVWSWALQLSAICWQNDGGIFELCIGNSSIIRLYYFSTLASRFCLCVIMMIENVTLCVEDLQSNSTLLRIIIHEVVQLFQTPASTCDYITMQTLSSTVHTQDCCDSPLCGRPLPPRPEASLISPRGMWCDLAISAWQHGSDAVKCHFTVAHRGSKLLQGLNPWWWGINGTRVLVKGQTTRLMCPQCLYSCYGRNTFKQCVAVYVIVKILSEWRWHGDNNSLSPQ